jgi:hypothetical protein
VLSEKAGMGETLKMTAQISWVEVRRGRSIKAKNVYAIAGPLLAYAKIGSNHAWGGSKSSP